MISLLFPFIFFIQEVFCGDTYMVIDVSTQHLKNMTIVISFSDRPCIISTYINIRNILLNILYYSIIFSK